MFILDVQKQDPNTILVHIGSPSIHHHYTICIRHIELYHVMCSCGVEEYCSHIRWLGQVLEEYTQPRWWRPCSVHLLCSLYAPQHHIAPNTINVKESKGGECVICLEPIVANQNVFQCQAQCKIALHTLCWNKYTVYTGNTKCVICKC